MKISKLSNRNTKYMIKKDKSKLKQILYPSKQQILIINSHQEFV